MEVVNISENKFNKNLHVNIKYILTIAPIVISIFSLLFTIYSSNMTKKEIRKTRIQQISISAPKNKTYVGINNVSYDIEIYNGSEVIISNVTLIAPEQISNKTDKILSKSILSESNIYNGIYIGEIPPNQSYSINVEMIKSEAAQLENFSIEFKDTDNNIWIKEYDRPAIKKYELEYIEQIDVIYSIYEKGN